MPNPQASVNVVTQIGPESTSTPGTIVPATHQLGGLYFTDDIKADTFQFTPQGHLHPTESVQGKQWSEHNIVADFPDFNGILYPFCSLFGVVTPTTPVGGTNSRKWSFTEALVNALLGQTYSLERGSAVYARKYGYVTADALTLSGTYDKISISGHAFGQAFNGGITLTSGLPEIAAIPMSGTTVNVYLDTTSAGIGTTQLMVSSWSIAFSGYYTPRYEVNRANASFSKLVPGKRKIEIKLKVEANTTGMALYTYLTAGQTVYPRIDILGPIIETTIHNELTLDSALKISAPAAFGDDQAVESIEFTGVVCEDTTWNSGTALLATLTNDLAAL